MCHITPISQECSTDHPKQGPPSAPSPARAPCNTNELRKSPATTQRSCSLNSFLPTKQLIRDKQLFKCLLSHLLLPCFYPQSLDCTLVNEPAGIGPATPALLQPWQTTYHTSGRGWREGKREEELSQRTRAACTFSLCAFCQSCPLITVLGCISLGFYLTQQHASS